jgi:pyruvate,orthophosphate dikinase
VAQSLERVAARLELAFGDAQDFEFTVEDGNLFLLQTREAKRSAWARLKIAVDLAREGVIAPQVALSRLEGIDLGTIVRRRVAGGSGDAIAQGVPAGIGVASGAIALTVEAVRAGAEEGRKMILVRNDIATDDVDGIAGAEGVLTARGGRTSHAAVVARELGKVAIVGCGALRIANDATGCSIAGHRFESGASITLDGETGRIYAGSVAVTEERPQDELAQLAAWQSQPERAASR